MGDLPEKKGVVCLRTTLTGQNRKVRSLRGKGNGPRRSIGKSVQASLGNGVQESSKKDRPLRFPPGGDENFRERFEDTERKTGSRQVKTPLLTTLIAQQGWFQDRPQFCTSSRLEESKGKDGGG